MPDGSSIGLDRGASPGNSPLLTFDNKVAAAARKKKLDVHTHE
ncbi:hypothetical protein [Promicromonospora soli]|nr:hypothetical protein [Promicromonospora soli]